MADSGSGGIYRLSLTYTLGEDGLLVGQVPATKVPVGNERALYRDLAALAEAGDAEIVAAATRCGPLGPTARVAIPDQPAFLWALDASVRTNLRNMRLLRAWIAHGGSTPIPGLLAPVAHALACVAEADDGTVGRVVEIITDGPPATELEKRTLDARLDRVEHRIYAGLSRRARLMNAQHVKGDHAVRVAVAPQAARRLPTAAKHWKFLTDNALQLGGVGVLIPPGSIGRLATELRPYFNQSDLPFHPEETIQAWREACRELARWVADLSKHSTDPADRRGTLTALLVLRLQQVDAWPYPTGDLLGTFPRALWSLWQPVTGGRPQRPCTWLGCAVLLPADAHGNRRFCDLHRRMAARDRAARNRARQRVSAG